MVNYFTLMAVFCFAASIFRRYKRRTAFCLLYYFKPANLQLFFNKQTVAFIFLNNMPSCFFRL
ncbi:hypothetical protein HYN49_14840 [Flavobacterium pallidum]|uniref:Uncharacterized protein n=1 Tax=Flavobacterium pallidum TaxID=2172098 RepID=A0A2S1SKZ6_9FLAO|nr:hypothetical protein HYN49_14840 [Flavobacterium pallidum]